MLANYTRVLHACIEYLANAADGTPMATVKPELMLTERSLSEFICANLLPQCKIENHDKRFFF